MNVLNLYTRLYARLHSYPGVPYWVLTPLRRMVRKRANRVLPKYLARTSRTAEGHTEAGVIISFTSFPARIDNLWQVVKSLKNQSVLPEKIILWLSKEQFPTRESIPASLWNEEDGLFEIRMVDEDIRSHKKFYYVMQEYPGRAFVNCDDDVYYHPDMLKHLVEGGKQFPGCVVANITRQIAFGEGGDILPYAEWKNATVPFVSQNQVQIGVGGVLYPPGVLHELTLRKDLFLKLTPMADDIWLNCMARLNGTPVVHSAMKLVPLGIRSDAPSLRTQNIGGNGNDRQLVALREYLRGNGLADVYRQDYEITPPLCSPIVSFTSFPARINEVWQVVECMKRQTCRPAKIILWLSNEQFPSDECIPNSLKSRVDALFEIRMVDGDVRSHKKYLYVCREYPDSLVFLMDDDIYYPTDILERTMMAHREYPEAVICNYGYHVCYGSDGNMTPYSSWPREYGFSTSDNLFFGSGGGTLFRPKWLHEDLVDIDLATRLAPTADDIWLNAMVLIANRKKVMLPNGHILPVQIKDNVRLASKNVGASANDNQLEAVMAYYNTLGKNLFA